MKLKKMAAMGAELDAALAANRTDMTELVAAFRKEFPPCVGHVGYLLVLVVCGNEKSQKKCGYCPHSLAWRRFDYTKRRSRDNKPKVWWVDGGPRLTSLPAAFLSARRKSAVRFRFYNDRMRMLNARRKKLTAGLLAMRAAYRSFKTALIFKETL
jgi:hypothetical protein